MNFQTITLLLIGSIVISVLILTFIVIAHQQRELLDWEREYEQGTQKVRERLDEWVK